MCRKTSPNIDRFFLNLLLGKFALVLSIDTLKRTNQTLFTLDDRHHFNIDSFYVLLLLLLLFSIQYIRTNELSSEVIGIKEKLVPSWLHCLGDSIMYTYMSRDSTRHRRIKLLCSRFIFFVMTHVPTYGVV